MFANAIHNSLVSSFEQTINLLGTPAVWTQNDEPNATANMIMGVRRTSKNDEEIINAYGQGAILGTARASDFPVEPKKFDKVVVENQELTVTSVNPVAVNQTIIFYKLIMKGK